jgi:hypothetical protein
MWFTISNIYRNFHFWKLSIDNYYFCFAENFEICFVFSCTYHLEKNVVM